MLRSHISTKHFVNQSAQVEIDVERHVLTQTKKLSDGAFEKIFSRNPRNESGMFTYNCHLCNVACLPGERALQTHIPGKKHQQRLMYDYVPNAEQFRSVAAPVKPKLSVFPGEPVPPGFEDEVNSVSYLEGLGSKQLKPLIGLEYVVELIDQNVKEPAYVCTLCDKRCDPRSILQQIVSHRHRIKYLEVHFTSFTNALNRDLRFSNDMAYREQILSAASKMIESKSKRGKPRVCEYREFERNKNEIVAQIKNGKHFSDKDWPESEILLVDLLKRKLPIQELETVSSDSDDEFSNPKNHGLQTMASMASKSYNDKPSRVSSSAFFRGSPENSKERSKMLTLRELQEQSNAKMQEKYVIEKYKASVDLGVKELEKNFKEYEKCPEKHPLYSEEWKNFWSRRYKEISATGKNANDYDYKPEWIQFWTKRMKQLHELNVEKIKMDWRKKLNLKPETVQEIENSPSNNSRKSRSRTRSPIRSKRRRSLSHETISDDSDDEQMRKSDDRKKRRSTERSHSRFSDSPYTSRQSDYRSRENFDNSYYSSRSREYERNAKSKSPTLVDEGPISLISVCRLLSALESELGLLASPILDLLAKAVAREKSQPNSADELLFSNDNCNILETVREKLKGVLSANLIASNKVIAVKRAIQNIATLLHEVSKRQPTNVAKVVTSASHTNGNQVESDDPILAAKLEIAKVIMESLMAEGRSNVSTEELEILIESFMESAEAEEPELEVPVLKLEQSVKVEKKSSPPEKSKDNGGGSGLENLTDEDLQTLLRNFADLTSEEQSHLIAYLSKIEQTNPARVEKLRKYVNIGDSEDINEQDDKKSEINLDMDFASGIVESKPKKKSPVHVKPELSDDDYDDDAIVKKLSMKSSSAGESSKPKPISSLKDNSGLADSLMSSLMQSSLPVPTNSWDMSNVDMSSAYYQQQPQMSSYPNMMPMYDQQMSMQMNMGMAPMQHDHRQWPPNSGPNFYQGNQMPQAFQNNGNQNKQNFRGRPDTSNNRQLTGKGKYRN